MKKYSIIDLCRQSDIMKTMSRNKTLIRVVTTFLSAAVFFTGSTVFASTTTEKINEQKEKIDALEKQQDAAEQAAAAAAEEVTGLNSTLSGLNTSLSDLSNQIESLNQKVSAKEQEIAGKQGEIAVKKQQIEEAEAALLDMQNKADIQYADMKKRIQFMYENGQHSLFSALLSSKSISDFLSKAEYVESITSYDRTKLAEYNEIHAQIAETKKVLEAEEAELESQEAALTSAKEELDQLEDETEAKKGQVSQAIASTQDDIAKTASELADAQAMAAELEAQIEKEKEYELQLEQQKAREDEARIAAIKADEAENTAAPVVINSGSDQELLAALIYCEAGGEPYDGQVAVGCVVMNRVRSPKFPSTVSGVIYQSGQFSPVASGRLATVLGNGLTTDSCRQAAATVLAGNLPYPNFLYFRSARVALSIPVTWIGNQQFY